MANRPVYYLDENYNVKTKSIEFTWVSGFSLQQKQKSILNLHNKIAISFDCNKDEVLEISTKSKNKYGVLLSAFNLKLELNKVKNPVEVFFQASKVFENGGPYTDLLNKTSKDAKQDLRLKNSGKLISFIIFGENWSTEPKTLFYDWLYINGVSQNENLHKEIINYKYFTDIEFNPKKSINCQAKAAAVYLSLYKKSMIKEVIKNPNSYKKLFKIDKQIQTTLF